MFDRLMRFTVAKMMDAGDASKSKNAFLLKPRYLQVARRAPTFKRPQSPNTKAFNMFHKIMILVDDQLPSQAAVHHGITLAVVHHASVAYLYMPPAYTFPMVDMPGGGMAAFASHTAEQFEQQAQAKASEVLQAAEAAAQAASVSSVCTIAPGNASAEYVAEAAVAHACDLIVVASSGTNAVVRLLTGNVIPGLISRAPMPVMVCPAPHAQT